MNPTKLSAIILSRTSSKELFEMTTACINSLLASETTIPIEVIVIESNKTYHNSGFVYGENVKIIVPQIDFNFHSFLNIGISQAKGDYLALLNNDLIFQKNWFTEILKVQAENPEIYSFSPNGNKVALSDKKFQKGYKVRTHIFGWCIVVKKELFEKIGLLDEQFEFYYADNDYAMHLKKANISHAVVYGSHVDHLEKKSTEKAPSDLGFLADYIIPDYLQDPKYNWVLQNQRNLSGFLKFHGKWGSPERLYRRNKLVDIFIRIGIGYLNTFVLIVKKKFPFRKSS